MNTSKSFWTLGSKPATGSDNTTASVLDSEEESAVSLYTKKYNIKNVS